MRQTIGILGIPVDHLDAQATLERLDQFIAERRFHQVATANVDFLINAMHDQELRQILREADLVTPDGMPVVWASRLFRTPLPERVTGADLVPRLAAHAARKGYRIYMLGALSAVAARARDRMIEANPGLQIVGCVSPEKKPLLAMDNEALIEDIVRARPDILLVAFGNPKQEKWIHIHRDRLCDVPVCIGVGGTFDFLAGETHRAPGWMQRSGTEWLFRLAQEPHRLWRRYANDLIYFSQFLARQWWSMRPTRLKIPAALHTTAVEGYTIVTIEGPLTGERVEAFHQLAMEALNQSPHLILDMNSTTQIDARALGALLTLAKRAVCTAREVRIVGASPALHRVFRITHLDERIALYATSDAARQGEVTPQLQIALCISELRATCTLIGTATCEQVSLLENHLRTVPDTVHQVEVDLSGVTCIDCAMLLRLHEFVSQAKRHGRCVRLIVNPKIREVLVRERIQNDFELADTAPIFASIPGTSSAPRNQPREAS